MELTRVSIKFKHEGIYLYGRDDVNSAFHKLRNIHRIPDTGKTIPSFNSSRHEIFSSTMRSFSLADELMQEARSAVNPVFLNMNFISTFIPSEHQLSLEQTSAEFDIFLLKISGTQCDIYENKLAKILKRRRAISKGEVSITANQSKFDFFAFNCNWLIKQVSPFVEKNTISGVELAKKLSANPIEGYRLGKMIGTPFILSLAFSNGSIIKSSINSSLRLIVDITSDSKRPSLFINIELDEPRKNIYDKDLATQLISLTQMVEDKFKPFVIFPWEVRPPYTVIPEK